ERDFTIAQQALVLEGIVVTADPVSRATGEVATATVIDREAIRHATATSLSGVLEHIPGVPIQQPGLDNLEQLALRSVPTSGSGTRFTALPGGMSAGDLASFGTLIVLDGVPESNNANLHSLGPRGELSLISSAGGGIDLRRIPASTLERIEVIRGIPSVRWGDLTQGAVIVETRAGEVPVEIQAQYDARTGAAAGLGGHGLGTSQTGTLTFDFTGTRTAPGRSDDYAYRVDGQVMHQARFGSTEGQTELVPKLRLDTRLEFFQLFDDRPEDPNTGRNYASQTRDRGFRLRERARLQLGSNTRMQFTGSVTATQQRGWSWHDLTRTAQPFTNRLVEGRQEGHYVIGPYRSEVTVGGNPWMLYGRFELEGERYWLDVRNNLVLGFELRREWNSGPGVQFDIEFPPQATFNGVNGWDRPRANDEVPAMAASALYLDDRVQTRIGSMWLTAQAGLRLDLLHQGETVFSAVRDAMVQPRITVELAPVPWLRVRSGWGHTAKLPPQGLLYPAPQYYDIVNVNYFANDPVERLAVLTTNILDPTNPDLGFSRGSKAEVGIELGLGASAVGLVAFSDRIDGGVGYRNVPVPLPREHFALTDSVLGNGIRPEIIEPAEYSDTVPVLLMRPDNVLHQRNRGLELTAFLPEIPFLKTRFQVTGSWVQTEQWSDGLYYGRASDFSDFQLRESDPRTPYWEQATEVGQRVLLLYRLIHHQPHAGLIITATVQHNIHDEIYDVAATDTLAFEGYLTRAAEHVAVPLSERGRDDYSDLRLPRSGLLVEPAATGADWMMSIQVSKTLPLDGRLNFWAFNLLDRLGKRNVGSGQLPRRYQSVRVGLEVSLSLGALYR
ncbi:MAG: TonB-dependent receptor, partial [Gemmatimonadota bacterium]